MRPDSQPPARGGVLVRSGLLAGPVFVGASVIQGLQRRDYRSLRHPVSSLAIGRGGSVQSANFVITGALCGAFSIGLARQQSTGDSTVGRAAIALGAAGLVASGAFTADPINGYPPGTPPVPARMTRSGYAHVVASSAVMLGVPVAAACYGWAALRADDRRWAAHCFATSAFTASAFGAACAGFAQAAGLAPVAGGLQRAAVTAGFCWLTALARRALRPARPSGCGPRIPGSTAR